MLKLALSHYAKNIGVQTRGAVHSVLIWGGGNDRGVRGGFNI